MKQKFASAERLMIHDVAVGIGTDVCVKEENLVVLYDGIAVGEVREAEAQGFDLGTLKREPGLEGLFNEIIMMGLAIRGNCRVRFILCHDILLKRINSSHDKQ